MFFMGWIAPMCFIFVSWAGKLNFFMGWIALSFHFPSSRWRRVRCTALDPSVGEDLRGGRRCHSMSRFGWPFRAEHKEVAFESRWFSPQPVIQALTCWTFRGHLLVIAPQSLFLLLSIRSLKRVRRRNRRQVTMRMSQLVVLDGG